MNKKIHGYSLVKLPASILGAAFMFAIAGMAQAQTAPGRVSMILSDGEEATVFASVPEGFEPNTATDRELLDYGYPARPDPSNAGALALWQRAVHMTRVSTDLVEKPGKFHRPAQALQTTNATTTTGNWSAVAIDGASAKWDNIVGYWAVPNVASQAAGEANGYSSMWVGLDGLNLADLIQDGTESDWVGGKPSYDAWVEVLPSAEVVLPGLPVSPGDGMYAATQYKVVSGKAYAYFYMTNFNTGKSVSTSIAFPTNLKYTGQTAEWVVERTELNGTYEHPMPRYGLAFMSDAYVQRSGSSTLYYANSNPASLGTTYYISMYDTPTATTLSKPLSEGIDSIIFEWLKY
jgi:hypothetical protein